MVENESGRTSMTIQEEESSFGRAWQVPAKCILYPGRRVQPQDHLELMFLLVLLKAARAALQSNHPLVRAAMVAAAEGVDVMMIDNQRLLDIRHCNRAILGEYLVEDIPVDIGVAVHDCSSFLRHSFQVHRNHSLHEKQQTVAAVF